LPLRRPGRSLGKSSGLSSTVAVVVCILFPFHVSAVRLLDKPDLPKACVQ
jgi:hypothetical protein